MAARAASTACAVPSRSVWTKNSGAGAPRNGTSESAALTCSAPLPTTRASASAPEASAAAITWAAMGSPPTGCSTFGSELFIRVPSPAARMMARQLRFLFMGAFRFNRMVRQQGSRAAGRPPSMRQAFRPDYSAQHSQRREGFQKPVGHGLHAARQEKHAGQNQHAADRLLHAAEMHAETLQETHER